MRTFHALAVALGVLGLAVLGLAAPAAAQPAARSVRITVESLFGEGTLIPDAYVPVLVTLESHVARDLRGELELVVEGYDQQRARHVTPVDLPARSSRQVVLTLFTESTASGLTARYVADGREAGVGGATFAYTSDGRTVVVMGDPPRLRGALLDLDVEEQFPSGPRQLRTGVGVVRFDLASADPMLPTEAVGWSSVRLLVASAPVLLRASQAQRAAIEDWLRAGGRLLVHPRVASDLQDPWLRSLAGPVELGPAPTDARALVPDRGERFGLECSEAQRVESFGCSARVGFGRIYFASYDVASPAAIETGVPRELVRSLYAARELGAPAFVLGRHHDALESDYYGGSLPGLGAVRAALDPNESFRPALIFVALALLLYVIVVGPLNFRWVQKRNQPTLALITTPLAALGCLAVLLAVGYVGKGVTMRYRRFEVLEAVEDQRRVTSRRYTGLYVTRPGSFDLPGTPRGEAAHRIAGGGSRGPVHRHEGERVRMTDFRAGLWETVFVREDRMVDLPGTVRFERDARRLAAVVNDSPAPLTHAFVMESSGAVYVVGEVPAGGRAAIPRSPAVTLYAHDPEGSSRTLADLLGIDPEERRYLRGIVQTVQASPSVPGAADVPVLFARLPSEGTPIADRFVSEADHRWLRLVPRLRGEPVLPAAPPIDPMAPPPPVLDDAGIDSDAGVDAAIEPPPEVTL